MTSPEYGRHAGGELSAESFAELLETVMPLVESGIIEKVEFTAPEDAMFIVESETGFMVGRYHIGPARVQHFKFRKITLHPPDEFGGAQWDISPRDSYISAENPNTPGSPNSWACIPYKNVRLRYETE